MTKLPVGEVTLSLAGSVSTLEGIVNAGLWDLYFVEVHRYQTLKRQFLSINWGTLQCYLGIQEAYKIIGNKAIERFNTLRSLKYV